MRTRWTKEEMESVLIQLNKWSYPFENYSFLRDSGGLILLGSGGYANVYEMAHVKKREEQFAVKVLGFGEKHVDSKEFRKSVEIQKELGSFQKDVVKIIDYIELRIELDGDSKVLHVEKVPEHEEKMQGGDYLNLQFILMEKLVPILTMDKRGKPRLFPEELANFKETEIMKLAHNIGVALTRAHAKNLLHRDIKLENIFYDPKKKVYKLGDFGIAKMTDDGMASTVAFTKGYGAPEVVGAIDERYDNTADIYSFGIMLYLLLNELKFPDSENYNVNVSVQYSKGYVFPCPEHSEYGLYDIIDGMCQYNPDERYQSMDEILNDIEGILLGENIRYKKEKQKATYVVAMVCYLVGIVLWKLTHMPTLSLDIGVQEYLFLMAGGYEYWLNLKKKRHERLSFIMLCFGVYLLVTTGFTWWKLLFILGVVFSTDFFAGVAVSGVIIVDMLSRMMQYFPEMYSSMEGYNWTAVLVLSFSFALFVQYAVLEERDMQTNSMYFRNNVYWIFIVALYGGILINGLLYRYAGVENVFKLSVIGVRNEIAGSYDLFWLGLGGIGLSVGWYVRERVLRKVMEGV